MKFTVLGFSQEIAINYGLDLTDLMILRYFVDFKDSGEMVSKIIKNDKYYWLKYEKLLEGIPVINITSKDVLRRRLKYLVDKEILKHETVKLNGKYSFYTIGNNYKKLIYKPTEKSEGYDPKVGRDTTEKSEPYDSKVGTNNYSIKDTSIKDINSMSCTHDCTVIIDYLNIKTGKSFKATTSKTKKLIQARMNENFRVEDFKKVIDIKTKEWKSTDFEQYLRPDTLFGTKFESYLNQKEKGCNKSNQYSNTDFDYS